MLSWFCLVLRDKYPGFFKVAVFPLNWYLIYATYQEQVSLFMLYNSQLFSYCYLLVFIADKNKNANLSIGACIMHHVKQIHSESFFFFLSQLSIYFPL